MSDKPTNRYACYRRPDPETGEIYRRERQDSTIGHIEYASDPALFFHAEKYRGSNESVRVAIMAAATLSDAGAFLQANPLSQAQMDRWIQVRTKVLSCAMWFATTQHTGKALSFSPDLYDGLDVMEAAREVQARLQNRRDLVRLVIAGSRDMTDRPPGYALIDWYVANRGAIGHGASRVDEVVSGNANGGDSIGEEWAMRSYIPVAHFPSSKALWDALGKRAGMARNKEMEKVGTHLLAFHLHDSKGTANIIDLFNRSLKAHWKFTEKDVAKIKQGIAGRSPLEAANDSSFN